MLSFLPTSIGDAFCQFILLGIFTGASMFALIVLIMNNQMNHGYFDILKYYKLYHIFIIFGFLVGIIIHIYNYELNLISTIFIALIIYNTTFLAILLFLLISWIIITINEYFYLYL